MCDAMPYAGNDGHVRIKRLGSCLWRRPPTHEGESEQTTAGLAHVTCDAAVLLL